MTLTIDIHSKREGGIIGRLSMDEKGKVTGIDTPRLAAMLEHLRVPSGLKAGGHWLSPEDGEAWLRRLPFALRGGGSGVWAEESGKVRKFSADQPRTPAGHKGGGRWMKIGALVRAIVGDVKDTPNEKKTHGLSMDELYTPNEPGGTVRNEIGFQKRLRGTARRLGTDVRLPGAGGPKAPGPGETRAILGPTKLRDTAEGKLAKYAAKGIPEAERPGHIGDINRGSISVGSPEDIPKAVAHLKAELEQNGWTMGQLENQGLWSDPGEKHHVDSPMGFRMIAITVHSPDGQAHEIQITTTALFRAREISGEFGDPRSGHDLYDEIKGILRNAAERELTKTERARIEELTFRSRKLYNAAWAESNSPLRPEGEAYWPGADHAKLVEEALYKWKGDPTLMRELFEAERRGDPQPPKAGNQKVRAEAAALLWELEFNWRRNPTPLYRGSKTDPGGFQAWSESRETASRFALGDASQPPAADHGEAPRVSRIPAEKGHGIRVGDYLEGSSLDEAEQEWIILTTADGAPAAT